MELSTQQQEIVEAVARGDCDIEVTARAGCGKTTTILAASGNARGRVGFCAYNKSIARELSTKADPRVQVQTTHSLGARTLSAALGYRPELDPDKCYLLAKARTTPKEIDLLSPISKLVDKVKNTLADPTDDNLYDLSYTYEIDLPDNTERLFDLVREVLTDCVPIPGVKATIDFNDMLWLPVIMEAKPAVQYDWMFIDEAQDLNPVQMELLLRATSRGHICYVGDPAQAIYAFRGADNMAMSTLKARLRGDGRKVTELKLTETRRCPQRIVKLAQQYVPDFVALPEAPLGKVTERRGGKINVVPGDMCICRFNAPLIGVAFECVRAGVPVKIQGKDIGAGIKVVVDKLHPTSIDNLLDLLPEWHAKEITKLNKRLKDKPSKLETAMTILSDKVKTIEAIAQEQNTIDELYEAIDRLFGDMNRVGGVVLLSSIHKAKGLEADRIVWLVPSQPCRGEQEDNLKYVAITRAKRELVIHHEE